MYLCVYDVFFRFGSFSVCVVLFFGSLDFVVPKNLEAPSADPNSRFCFEKWRLWHANCYNDSSTFSIRP